MPLFEQKAPGIMVALMRDLGLTDFQAGGMLGNMGWECSGFAELHQGGGGNAIGWIQWDGTRKTAYLAWCRAKGLAWTSDQANYGYVVEETLSTERASLTALRAATTLKEATDVFEKDDERAGAPALSGRESYARRAMAAYAAAPKPIKPIFGEGAVAIPPAVLPRQPDDPGVEPTPKKPAVTKTKAAVAGGAVIATAAAIHQGVPMSYLVPILLIALIAGAVYLFRNKIIAAAEAKLAPPPAKPAPIAVAKPAAPAAVSKTTA